MSSEDDRLNVFVSYASERAEVAADIAAALQAERYQVFFDRQTLRPGRGYDAKIRDAIAGSQLFVILISPEMFKKSSYVLTELEFAKKAWPSPVGRLLPVIITKINRRSLDPFLRRVTPLYPQGDVAAEVAAEVHALLRGATDDTQRVVRPEVAASQLEAYRALWSITGLLPKWPRADAVSRKELAGLSSKLRDWYFGSAGGLFLTSRAYSRYSDLQDALQNLPADSRTKAISDDEYEEIRSLCSLLRRQMALDVGTRI